MNIPPPLDGGMFNLWRDPYEEQLPEESLNIPHIKSLMNKRYQQTMNKWRKLREILVETSYKTYLMIFHETLMKHLLKKENLIMFP